MLLSMKTCSLNSKFGFRIPSRRPNRFYAIVLERQELLPRLYFELHAVQRLQIRWTDTLGWPVAIHRNPTKTIS
jgi:hypothetical protein